MPRYGIGVGFDFLAEDDEHAQEVVDEIIGLINAHPLTAGFASQIEAWPECQQDCPEEEDDD